MLIRILHLAPGCSHFLGPPVISHPGNQEICSFFFCFLEVQCAIHCATQPPFLFCFLSHTQWCSRLTLSSLFRVTLDWVRDHMRCWGFNLDWPECKSNTLPTVLLFWLQKPTLTAFIHSCMYSSIHLSIHPFIHLSTNHTYPSIYPPTHPPNTPTHPSILPSILRYL